MIYYHGTRNYNGGDLLPYNLGDMQSYIEKLLEKIGLSWFEWADKGHMAERVIANLKDKKRQRIWITDNVTTAKSYATRSPEIAWDVLLDAIDNVLWGRRWRQSNTLKLCKQRNDWIGKLLEGEPMVITVSLEVGGFNYPVGYISEKDIMLVEQIRSG